MERLRDMMLCRPCLVLGTFNCELVEDPLQRVDGFSILVGLFSMLATDFFPFWLTIQRCRELVLGGWVGLWLSGVIILPECATSLRKKSVSFRELVRF